MPADDRKSTFLPWEASSEPAVEIIQSIVLSDDFWEKLSGHYSEENHEDTVTQDNVSFIKSICKSHEIYQEGLLVSRSISSATRRSTLQ